MGDPFSFNRFDQFVPFLDLPPEIRNRIYTFYFIDTYTCYRLIKPLSRGTENVLSKSEDDPREGRWQRALRTHKWKSFYDPELAIFKVAQTNTALLMACKQIYREALPVYLSTRVFSYTEEIQTRFVHIFPYLLKLLPMSFLQSIKHLKISNVQFIYCIDPSFSAHSEGTVIRSDLFEELGNLLATSVFPNLKTFTLETEISRHNLRLHYLPTADEIHRRILMDDFDITQSATKPITICGAVKMLSDQWPTIQSVTWKFSLFWSVNYIAYGTIHRMERFGWNTYLYDGKLDTLSLERDESWTAEREAKEDSSDFRTYDHIPGHSY